jgi:hypothetical protein
VDFWKVSGVPALLKPSRSVIDSSFALPLLPFLVAHMHTSGLAALGHIPSPSHC